MTICQFKDRDTGLKCNRKAVTALDGKPYCNSHLQDVKKEAFRHIDYEKVERDLDLNKGGT